MKKSKGSERSKQRAALAVVLLSVLSLEIALLSNRLFTSWDASCADMFMRWRSVISASNAQKPDDLVLLAVDSKTQSLLGRYGSGMWISRKPFTENLILFNSYFKPTVLAYDILLLNSLEKEYVESGETVSESKEKLKLLANDLAESSKGQAGEELDNRTLSDLNRLIAELGNKSYANLLAEIDADDTFEVLLGMNVRGGTIDPQDIRIEGWSDRDVFGDDEDGDVEGGYTIPYLLDMAIPEESIDYGTFPQTDEPSPNGNMPITEFLDYGYVAPLNGPRDEDGVVRRLPMLIPVQYYNSKTKKTRRFFIPSFSLAATLIHLGYDFPLEKDDLKVEWGKNISFTPEGREKMVIPVDDRGRMYLNYDCGFNHFKAVSFVDVSPSRLRKRFEANVSTTGRWRPVIDGRIAVIGVTDTGIDVGATPLSSNIPMVYVHMTAINNILKQSFIQPSGLRLRAMVWAFMFAGFTFVCLMEKRFVLAPISLLYASLYFGIAYYFVHQSIALLPVAAPLVYVAVGAFSVLSFRFFTEERAKRKIRGMFSTMVSAKVLSYIEDNPETFSLRGRDMDVTVFFSDVADFTTISESLKPESLTSLMNTYLTPVTDCIIENDGLLDKYVGDSVMAVWGAPNADQKHAVKACLCALEQQKIIRGMKAKLKDQYGSEFNVRMGINSGIVTAGNMGSERKMQYTVMGDTVNLASRLEPTNKDFGTEIMIGSATYEAARDVIEARMLDRIVVKGKKNAVPVYELLGKKGDVPEELMRLKAEYEKALSLYHSREWGKVIEVCDSIAEWTDDKATRFLKERALNYQVKPPADSWQGEYVRRLKG